MPDQAKELLDHLESVLSNEPVEVVAGNAIVEVKPQGISKVPRLPRINIALLLSGKAAFLGQPLQAWQPRAAPQRVHRAACVPGHVHASMQLQIDTTRLPGSMASAQRRHRAALEAGLEGGGMWAGLLLIRHPALFICAQGDAVERILLEAARANTAHDVVLAAPKQACLCFLLCAQGGAVERILLEAARANTAHDVVLCIGDDRSDEDMYTAIEHVAVMPHLPAEVWGP